MLVIGYRPIAVIVTGKIITSSNLTKQNRTIYLHQHKQFPNNKLTHLAHKRNECDLCDER